ncbi:tetratricopeptide repeat protein [uncultured Psychroserpens sp.]|uniref:tetratricopeptide repeat protein n=1 Tax=uncultured Psychroserpens sp. TaxID=255436 RepID=UPI0026340CFF|nr:tetratricopeptide repeat protein [uncultured Psychroserpens sp.]
MRIFFSLIILFTLTKTEAQSSVLNRADSLYINGNYTKAIEAYKAYDNPLKVYNKIAKSYVAIGNYDLALENYKLSIESDPKDALTLYEYAKLLSKTKKFKESIEVFNALMNIDYRNPNYHYEMGLALERMKDSTAINRFKSAYDLDKTHQKAIYKLAKDYLKRGRHSLVDKYTDIGFETYKNNVELISLRAQSYYFREYYTKAQQWFEKLIKLGESSEFIHEKLSMCYAQNYEYELAIEQRLKVLKYNPFDTNSMLVIGKYYENLKDYTNAEKYIRQALKLQDVPLDFEYQRLGVVLNRQDKHKEAIIAFERSLKENPENLSSAFYIVTTKDKYYSDTDAKIKLYQNFIKSYPESYYLRFAEQRIKELKEEQFLKEKQ